MKQIITTKMVDGKRNLLFTRKAWFSQAHKHKHKYKHMSKQLRTEET